MKRIYLLLLAGLSLASGSAWSGSLYDPFLERYQVGAYKDPAAIDLKFGFPADLLEPVIVDTVWTRAAAEVLTAWNTPGSGFLTPGLLTAASNWRASMERTLQQLQAGTDPGDWEYVADPLLAERASRAVFEHLRHGRQMQAAALAIKVRDRGAELGLSPREIFVWDLRAKLLFRLAGNSVEPGAHPWPTMLDLGPFDSGNAWTLWMAHCRDLQVDPLPPAMTTEAWGRHLMRIGTSRLKPAELYDSDLTDDFKAGLGAVMFKGTERNAHFLKYPDPPGDNGLQGLWIRGRRLQAGGDPATYEQLASRPDILPGWRLDVWRRASEARLLRGQWTQGMEDLEEALKLASLKAGHWTTRRRLRQWNEQALVLALAQGDTSRARELRDLGLEYFEAKDRQAFLEETGHWADRLDPGANLAPAANGGELEVSILTVATGQAADIQPAEPARKNEYVEAAATPLWDLWIKWGIALANPDPVSGSKRERAIVYRRALEDMVNLEAPLDQTLAALALIHLRLDESPVFSRILDQAFDRDVGLASGWKTPPTPSAVPDLLPLLRGSELDRHALLGFALAMNDMRGILAVAVELEGRGLTDAEKRRFLYPLPGRGAIDQAIRSADSDPALLLAVARNESLFEPSVRSRAGALGWMQIMPFHYENGGADPGDGNWRNPGVSIRYGDDLLVQNGRRYGNNPYQAVAAYNAGPKAASRWEKQLGGSPDRAIYLAWIGYPETRHYVEKVLIDREIYDWIIRAGSGE